MAKRIYSEKLDLVDKSREAMLSAVQIYNNPLIKFKTESFIVLSIISWTYLMHAYYRSNNIEYKYFKKIGNRRRFDRNPDGSYRYWDLKKCISVSKCPLDKNVVNNLNFLIGLRNQVEHKKAIDLDSYMSARYQACVLNYNFYLKKFNGKKYGLDNCLALSIQFAELDYNRVKLEKMYGDSIPQSIKSYIESFDKNLKNEEIESELYAYRLLFTKITAKRKGQADRVIEFIDPKSPMAKSISKEYWVKEEKERPKLSATQVIAKVQKNGFKNFGMHQHTLFWKKHNGKNPDKGYGVKVVNYWYWYYRWVDFIISELTKENEQGRKK